MADPALFLAEGDHFTPTGLCRGGWSDEAQHGGPPTGLLARAVETIPTVVPMQVARFTIDLYREVPLTRPLTVATELIRDGRRIQLAEATMSAGSVQVARATCLKIRASEVPIPAQVESWSPPPGPDEAHPVDWDAVGLDWGPTTRFHLHAVEIRTVEGTWHRRGEGVSWVRLAYPVVAGEEPSSFVRTATLVDLGNGNSQALDGREWLYVNPDITLYLHRPPRGEWLGLRSHASQHATGIGFADTLLFDGDGPVGRVGQSQVLEPRSVPAE